MCIEYACEVTYESPACRARTQRVKILHVWRIVCAHLRALIRNPAPRIPPVFGFYMLDTLYYCSNNKPDYLVIICNCMRYAKTISVRCAVLYLCSTAQWEVRRGIPVLFGKYCTSPGYLKDQSVVADLVDWGYVYAVRTRAIMLSYVRVSVMLGIVYSSYAHYTAWYCTVRLRKF